MAQDDYYYEIQLTNKQLVFYFMAGASGLVLSFLAGIMVGRGVDPSAEVQAAASRPAYEDTIIKEEPPAAKSTPLPAEQLTYTTALQSDKSVDPPSEAKPKASIPVTTLPPTTDRRAAEPVRMAAATAAPAAPPPMAAAPSGDRVVFQVGAFTAKGNADNHAKNLKKQGYAAYVVDPDGSSSLFTVRVGPYSGAGADDVQKRLLGDKLKPFRVP